MLWILLLIIVLMAYFILIKWNNVYNVIFLLGIMAIFDMLFSFVLCTNIISSLSISSNIDYFVYKLISNFNISIFDIKIFVSSAVVLFIMSVTVLCIKDDVLFAGKTKHLWYSLLFVISAVCIFWLNSEQLSEKLYISIYEARDDGRTNAAGMISAINNGIIFFYGALLIVNMVWNIKNTRIIFRKRSYFLILCTESIIFAGILLSLYFTPLKFFYNNYDLYNFSVLYAIRNYNVYFAYYITILCLILIGMFLLIKYNILKENRFFRKLFPKSKTVLEVDEIRHIFHTYKNAMFSISAISDMGLSKDNVDDMKLYFLKIKNCANGYGHHVGRFLGISNNAMIMDDSFSLTDSLIKATQLTVVPSNVKLIKNIETSDDIIRGNFMEITDVFSNLIINAIDAINKKSVEGGIITITMWNEKNFLCVDVEDNGIGIRRKHINKIFIPFYTSTKSNKNWGLGLPHIKSVIEKHGGYIDVVSKVGVYTKFQFVIPIANARTWG